MDINKKQVFLILCVIFMLATSIDMIFTQDYLWGTIKLILALGIFVIFSKDRDE